MLSPPANNPIESTAERQKVLQITDTHLFANKLEQLQGHCTYKNLCKVVDHIRTNVSDFDFVLLTGDISQDGSAESYEHAATVLHQLERPVFWIAGNHDHLETVRLVFGKYPRLHELTSLISQTWDFHALNTCRSGTDAGYVAPSDLAKLSDAIDLSATHAKRVAVVMHHHPVPVETPLVDDCGLQENDALVRLLREKEVIELVLCGHVHGDYKVLLDAVTMESCPASSFQWKKGTARLETENRQGYKLMEFDESGWKSSTTFCSSV